MNIKANRSICCWSYFPQGGDHDENNKMIRLDNLKDSFVLILEGDFYADFVGNVTLRQVPISFSPFK